MSDPKSIGGFDCVDHYREHAFLVSVRRGEEPVRMWEVFGREPAEEEREHRPEILLRAELGRERWDVIAPEMRTEFNRRLKAEGCPVGRWAQGDNAVGRLLGKEVLVLAWAVEAADVTAEELPVAVRNWLGLKPEERWWLYTMTAAATGFAHQTGLGWRGALRTALCFGTGRDLFSLGSMTERGTLPPRPNLNYAAPAREDTAARPSGGKPREPDLLVGTPT